MEFFGYEVKGGSGAIHSRWERTNENGGEKSGKGEINTGLTLRERNIEAIGRASSKHPRR